MVNINFNMKMTNFRLDRVSIRKRSRNALFLLWPLDVEKNFLNQNERRSIQHKKYKIMVIVLTIKK